MTDKPKPHIGMKLWAFDINRRVYKKDEKGRSIGSPIWREHWVPVEIIGETKLSWLVGGEYLKTWNNPERHADKLPKRSFPGRYATSEQDIEREAFVAGRHSLSDRLRRCTDYDTLKAIEAALDAWDALDALDAKK